MSAPSSQAWILAATRRRVGYADLRLSDAERAEVADLLSRHYADGRLDQAEFDERLDQAMKAKTYSDLSGLFADLPRIETSDAAKPGASRAPGTSRLAGASRLAGTTRLAPRRYPRPSLGALFLVTVIVIAAAAGHVLAWSLSPWVSIVILGVIVLYATRIRSNRS